MWADLKTFLAKQKIKSEEEAVKAIEAFRLSLTAEKCKKYINILKKVIT